MSEKEVKAMLSDAQELVSNHCGQIRAQRGRDGFRWSRTGGILQTGQRAAAWRRLGPLA